MATTAFNGARVLLTGHTGFKGSWAVTLLNALGANVFGVSNDVPLEKNHIYFEYKISSSLGMGENLDLDVADLKAMEKVLTSQKFDFIFHFAAQALVSESIEDPIRTIRTNTLGVANVLHLCRLHQPGSTVIIVTSDKCYEPVEEALPYKETHFMGGEDPYSASKAAAEIIYSSFIQTFKVKSWPGGIATVRAGNVFGGGDWSSKRLVPDIVRNMSLGKATVLRLPEATRPWTYVLDVVYGYLLLALKLRSGQVKSGESWNFASGEKLTVRAFAEQFCAELGGGLLDSASQDFEEVAFLELDSSKARGELRWSPLMDIKSAISMSSRWYADSEARLNLDAYILPYVESLENA